MKLDEKDKKILQLLKRNARLPIAEIAREVHLARTTVQERIARLQQKNIIKGYTTIVSNAADEPHALQVLVRLKVDTKCFDKIVTQLHAFSEVTRCAAISGSADLLVELSVANVEALEQCLAKIGTLSGITETDSNIILNTFLQR